MGRKLLLARKLLLLALVSIAAVPAAAEASSGRLDPSFGSGGRAFLPGSIEKERRGYSGAGQFWPLADGRVLVSIWDAEYRGEVVALLPSGKLDPRFGQSGSLRPKAPEGQTASFSSLTVDRLGRLIVLGSSSPLGAAPGPLSGDYPSQALVQRFTSDGRLDLSFGGGDGTLITDFGLPPAEPGLSPDLDAAAAVLDDSGRIVVRGRRAAGKIFGDKGSFSRDHEAFLARLSSDGAVDASFASEGVLPLPRSDWAGRLFPDPGGGILSSRWFGEEGTLFRLDPSGGFDPRFGERGGRPVPKAVHGSEVMYPLALDSAGRLLLSAGLPSWGDQSLPRSTVFKRLLPDGSLDREYGNRGLLVFRHPGLRTSAETVDREGRLLVAMTLGGFKRGKAAPPTKVALARLRADGSLDASFGRKGVLPIPLPGKAVVYLGRLEMQGDRKAVIQLDRCKEGRCRTVLVRVDLGA